MPLYILDYGAGNVRSLANSLTKLGHSFSWITSPDDFHKASKVIFPGVGAFHSAIEHLSAKGLLQPLQDYIRSDKPYLGICIGLQILFLSSAESPGTSGLGIIDYTISKFDATRKSVPHIGWNSVELLDSQCKSTRIDTDASYYFVHSYAAKYNAALSNSDWAYTCTEYGDETFVSSVRKDNVFATQFHPEKSGVSGLTLLSSWLDGNITPSSDLTLQMVGQRQFQRGFTKRVIACLDVRSNDQGDLIVTKGDQYDVREKNVQSRPGVVGTVRNLGKPVSLASRYFAEGADELCLLNITSFRHSPLKDQPMLDVVRATAESTFVPLTIGGGIKDTVDPDGTKHSALEVASLYFRAGADKVSLGSEAVFIVEQLLRGDNVTDNAISAIASVYGSQAVVVSIDPRRVYVDPTSYCGPYKDELTWGGAGSAWWYQCTVFGGREARPLSVIQLAKGVEQLGAGEILVNSIDRDGTGLGFDIALLQSVRSAVSIPIIASSGAGAPSHFVDLFKEVEVEGALAAGIFHRGEVTISEVKDSLHNAGIRARIQ